jgi:hypothetical protein
MYIPASRVALDRGTEIKPFQKTLFDRLRDLADSKFCYLIISLPLTLPLSLCFSSSEHNLVKEINDEAEIEISHEQISDWFYQGNRMVWNYLAPKTCGYFTLDNPIRQFCIETLLSKWFDWAILLAIIGNSLFIAANNPLDTHNESVSLWMRLSV